MSPDEVKQVWQKLCHSVPVGTRTRCRRGIVYTKQLLCVAAGATAWRAHDAAPFWCHTPPYMSNFISNTPETT
jgi:hypothetical protein